MPGVALARLTGEIDLANAGYVEGTLSEAVAARDVIVIDVAELGYVGSEGLSMLERLARRHASGGGGLVLVVPEHCAVRRTLEVVAFLGLPVARDSESGIQAARALHDGARGPLGRRG